MAISPISVSFKSNYNVSFESRKNRNKSHDSYSSNSLKAVPLAVLLAINPLNTIQAQNSNLNQGKIIATGTFKNACADYHATNRDKACEVFFVSTDRNDEDAEAIRLRFVQKSYDYLNVNGKKTKMSVDFTTDINAETLTVCNEIRTYKKSTPVKSKSYYVEGFSDYYRSNYYNDNGDVVEKGSFHKKYNGKVKITKELYDYLKETMGSYIKYKNTSETIDGDLETKMKIDGHVF